MSSVIRPLTPQIDTVLYTAAHGGFSGLSVPLGGGAAIANLITEEWCQSKPFTLRLLGPVILGATAPTAEEIVSFTERQYAAFCEAFGRASTREALKHDPRRTAILVNDISEGPDFERLARVGFRIFTIYHVDVVAYIASVYLRGWIRPETLSGWWERLRSGPLGSAAPTILRLIFEQQRASLLWSERVLVPSSDMRSIMLRCYPETPLDRIEILPWGCPLRPFFTKNGPGHGPEQCPVPARLEATPPARLLPVSSCAFTDTGLSHSSESQISIDAPPAPAPPPRSSKQALSETPGIPPLFRDPEAAVTALRAEYGIAANAHILLCLSRISPEKGQDFLLKTLIEWERSPSYPARPVWLFICGAAAFMNGHSYERRLRALAARLTRVHVVFPGYVTGDRKFSFLRLADVYLFPSSHESYGLTLVEALSFGLPAICRDHSGARQILTPEIGVIIPGSGSSARLAFRTALETILRDDSLRFSMACAASKWASQHPFSESASRLATLLVGTA